MEGQLDCPRVAERQKEKTVREDHAIRVVDERPYLLGQDGLLDSQLDILPLCCLGPQMTFILSG